MSNDSKIKKKLKSEINIAVLLTCHNRRDKTVACLNALFSSHLPDKVNLNVFLVDDGSTDGTGAAVQNQFPQVNLIKGSGSLYWNQGMRLAWQTAVSNTEFDFFLWLNDDTTVLKNTIIEMVNSYTEIINRKNKLGIITGACQSHISKGEFSYGGRNDDGPVIPNGELQECKYINGNVVLVSKEVFGKLGNLSPEFTHTMGDYDYGLRAGKKGILCYTTKDYIAFCEKNSGIPDWCNPQIPIAKRLQLLNSPKGLNLKEYIVFRKKFWGWRWIFFAVKAILKSVFPVLYFKISHT